MLKADLEFIVHYSEAVPKFVTVYRARLPWEVWSDRKTTQYGDLKLIPELSYGSEDTKKFSEGVSVVVSDYTEAENKARMLAVQIGLLS